MSEMFTLLNNSNKFSTDFVKQQFEKGIRPPNINYITENVMIKALFGGRKVNNVSPFINIKDVVIVCDGVIYNSKKLFEELGIVPETDYDYEIIVHLYIRYGIEITLQLLDGVFAFTLLDHRLNSPNGELDSNLYIARDRYGVKPLYLLRPNFNNIMIEHNKSDGDIYTMSSNLDMLKGFEEELNLINHPKNNSLNPDKSFYVIENILPGTYSCFQQKYRVMPSWRFNKYNIPYHICKFGFDKTNIVNPNQFIQEAVVKRIGNKQVNVILTGNYEAFMTAAIANEKLSEQEKYVNTFSWSESTYEKEIQLVTDYLKTNHTVVTVNDDDIENEKENIDPSFTGEGRLWLMAKTIARVAPNSVVFLEIGIDNFDHFFESEFLDENKEAETNLDFQYKLYNHFKTICSYQLNKILKIFWYHGLEVQIPWLDHELVQQFVTHYPNDINFIFNPIGIYGNKLLPEELFKN
jgi:asparagine synthase (glutamine-hydrolysing)